MSTRAANGANKKFVLHVQVWLAAVSLLVNEFVIRRVLDGQVSLAAVNHINVFYEVMNGYKNPKIH